MATNSCSRFPLRLHLKWFFTFNFLDRANKATRKNKIVKIYYTVNIILYIYNMYKGKTYNGNCHRLSHTVYILDYRRRERRAVPALSEFGQGFVNLLKHGCRIGPHKTLPLSVSLLKFINFCVCF